MLMLATLKHVFKMKTCRSVLKNHDLLSAASTFWFNYKYLFVDGFGVILFSVTVRHWVSQVTEFALDHTNDLQITNRPRKAHSS